MGSAPDSPDDDYDGEYRQRLSHGIHCGRFYAGPISLLRYPPANTDATGGSVNL